MAWWLVLFGVLVVGAVVALSFFGVTVEGITKRAKGFINGTPVDVELSPLEAQPGHWLAKEAARQFNLMQRAANADGVTFPVTTSFRDNDFQARLYAMYLAGTGNLAARPGYSTHQAGRSVDISTGGQGRSSLVFQWLSTNAARYNFRNDVASEPWHWTWYP